MSPFLRYIGARGPGRIRGHAAAPAGRGERAHPAGRGGRASAPPFRGRTPLAAAAAPGRAVAQVLLDARLPLLRDHGAHIAAHAAAAVRTHNGPESARPTGDAVSFGFATSVFFLFYKSFFLSHHLEWGLSVVSPLPLGLTGSGTTQKNPQMQRELNKVRPIRSLFYEFITSKIYS